MMIPVQHAILIICLHLIDIWGGNVIFIWIKWSYFCHLLWCVVALELLLGDYQMQCMYTSQHVSG